MRRVAASEIFDFFLAVLRRLGVSREHAETLADNLIMTSLHGVDTHGITYFPLYVADIETRRVNLEPTFRVSHLAACMLRLDANGALGHVAGMEAVRHLIPIAKSHGIGLVSVARSNHFGAARCYSLAMARAGLIGISMSNSDALVAPFSGLAALLGTNPIAVAMQGADGDTFSLDMATSIASLTKVRRHAKCERPLEPDWAIDEKGEPAIDPKSFAALNPIGAHKGQGLGMVIELLCTLLTGMPFDHEVMRQRQGQTAESGEVGHFFLGLDPGFFGDGAEIRRRLSQLLLDTAAQPARQGHAVRYPGQHARQLKEQRERFGIPLPDDVATEFQRIAEQYRVRKVAST